MAISVGDAVLTLGVDTKSFDKSMRDMEKKTKSSVDRIKDRFTKLRTTFLVVGGAALAGLGAATKMASDLEESMNKANEVFGESITKVRDFAATSANSFGISREAANSYAGTLGLILNASGLTTEASAGMSIKMVQLAADLASFNNIPIDQALEKLRSGLVGEVEPLRAVGVLLSQAAVELKAVELGLIADGEEMSEAVKVQARFALILEQTSTAQGDFARTSDSLANSLRRNQANLANASAELGMVLLPAISAVSNALAIITAKFATMSDPMKKIIVGAGLLAIAIAGIGLAIPPIIMGVGFLTAAFSPWLLAAAAVAGASVLIWKNWDKIKKTFEVVSDFVSKFFRSKWGWMLPGGVFVKAMLWVKDNWDKIWKGIKDTFFSVGNTIMEHMENIVNGVISALNFLITQANRLPWINIAPLERVEFNFKRTFESITTFVATSMSKAVEFVGNAVARITGSVKEMGDEVAETGEGVREDNDETGESYKKLAETIKGELTGVRLAIKETKEEQKSLMQLIAEGASAYLRGRGLITAEQAGQAGFEDFLTGGRLAKGRFEEGAEIPMSLVRMIILARIARNFPGHVVPPEAIAVMVEDLIKAFRGRGATVTGLATGGIVTRPTLAMLGERGPEAVIPLNGNGRGVVNIAVMLDSEVIARVIGAPLVDEIRVRTGVGI